MPERRDHGGANLLLGLIYGVVGYGLVAIVRWAIGRFLSQLVSWLTLLTRAVRLLTVLFIGQALQVLFVSLAVGAFFVVLGLLAIAMLTDSTYRQEFFDGLTDEMREVFKAHTESLRLRPETAAG